MKVWLGIYCYHNLCETWETVEKVFDDEVKALLWAEDPAFEKAAQRYNEEILEWRKYKEVEVE